MAHSIAHFAIEWGSDAAIISTLTLRRIDGPGNLGTDGTFLYWYQAGRLPSVGLARSPDARHWTRLPGPVLRPGPRGSWDERGVADPYVIRAGAFYYMFFLGQDRARRQRLGVARSADGVAWEKLRSNPILELGAAGAFDEKGLGEPAVWASQDRYWMLYTGRDRSEYRRIGLAWSRDGVLWERLPANTVLAGAGFFIRGAGRECQHSVHCASGKGLA